MKKYLMKTCAFLLTAVMLAESAFAVDVSAAQLSGLETTELTQQDGTAWTEESPESASEESTSEETTSEELASEETKTQTDTVSENEVPETQEGTVSDNEVEESQETAEIEDAEETEEGETPEALLQYLYVQDQYIKAPKTQYFLLGVGEETTELTEAKLTLTNLYTGETLQIEAEDCFQGMALFSKTFTDTNERSIYQVTKASFVADNTAQELDLSAIGVQAYFGVNEEVELTKQPQEEAIDLSQVQASIVTVDGMEIETTANQIDEALTEARSEMIRENVFEGSAAGESNIASRAVGLEKASGNVVIVLDPGHDATHAGASANGLKEEQLTLKIANYCKEELETYDGVTVYMTRTSEACPHPGNTSVQDNALRVQYAKSVGATAYVSIHLNASTSSASNGAIVYYPNKNYNSSIGSSGKNLASKIEAKLAALGLKNNGVAIRNSEDNSLYADGSLADYYGVIKNSKLAGFPGIIVEHAFLTNSGDVANFLSSDEKLKQLGVADATGIAEYYGLSKSTDEGALAFGDFDYGKGTFKLTLSKIAEGKTIQFQVYPKSDPSKSISYIGTYKNNVYTAKVDVAYHNYLSGDYVVIANQVQKDGSTKQVAKKTVKISEPNYGTVTAKAAATASSKKKFKLTTSAVANAKAVSFEVYNKTAGKASTKTYAATKDSSGAWTYTMKVSDFKLGGTYKVTAYAVSCFNTSKKIATTSFEVPAPKMSKLQLTSQNEKKGTFVLTVPNVTSEAGIKKVEVAVWSLADKSDLKVYKAKSQGNGSYAITGNIKYHDYNYGKYSTQVTVTAKNGISTISKVRKVTIKTPVAEISAKKASSQKTVKLKATNVALSGTVTDVRFDVATKANKKKDKLSYYGKSTKKGTWSTSISPADFGESGTYYVTVYAKSDKEEKYKKIGTTTFEITGPSISNVSITSKKDSKGTFKVTASGIKAKAGVAQVSVNVWYAKSKKDLVEYKATKSGSKYKKTVDVADVNGKKGTYKVSVTVTDKNGISTTYETIKVTMNTNIDTKDLYGIMGESDVTVEQMMAYYRANASYPGFYAGTDAPSLKSFCSLYKSECEAEGVRVGVAFAQAMKETNFLRYGGDVSIEQFNFAGLGATGGGAKGASFASVQIGIRAQVQHLKAYGSTDPLNKACVDGRFQYVTRGCAKYVQWLGINENPSGKGWATDKNYGYSIMNMLADIKNF